MIEYSGRHRYPWGREVRHLVRRYPALAMMVAVLALWAPYGAADAHGVTDPWILALRPTQGATAAVWPQTCNGVPGNVPCTQFAEDGRRLIYMLDELGREVAYETTSNAGLVRNTETGNYRLLTVPIIPDEAVE